METIPLEQADTGSGGGGTETAHAGIATECFSKAEAVRRADVAIIGSVARIGGDRVPHPMGDHIAVTELAVLRQRCGQGSGPCRSESLQVGIPQVGMHRRSRRLEREVVRREDPRPDMGKAVEPQVAPFMALQRRGGAMHQQNPLRRIHFFPKTEERPFTVMDDILVSEFFDAGA